MKPFILLFYFSLNLQMFWGMGVDTEKNPARILLQKGEQCLRDSDWIGALDNYSQMIPFYKQNPELEPALFAQGFNSAGNICQLEEQYIQGLDFYILGLEAAGRARDEVSHIRCLGNIGNIYMLFKDYESALEYYDKGYNRCVVQKDLGRQATFLTNMINTYCYMQQTNKAKECLQELMKLPVEDVEMQKFYNLISQAIIAQSERNFPAAVYFHKKAVEYACQHVLDERFIVAEYRELSNVYKDEGEIGSAIEYLKKSEEIATRRGYTMQMAECYKLLSELYGLNSDKDLESHYRILYVSFSDSINQREYNKVKNKLLKYEAKQNDSYIGELSEQINLQRWIIISVSVCFFIVLGLVVYIVRQNRMLQRAYHTLFNRNNELMDSDGKYKQMQMKYLAVIERLKKYQQTEVEMKDAEEKPDKKLPLTLSSEQTGKLLEDILKVMESSTFIYDSAFSLSQLAKIVNSNTKYVSWVINDTYDKNFRTFLNEYRIREACKRLLNTDVYGNLTIQAIAEDVGYKSITNFVVSFKKNVGITPSLYQKMARRGVSETQEEE